MTKKFNNQKLIIILLVIIILLQILILFNIAKPNTKMLNEMPSELNRIMTSEKLTNGTIIKRINYFINGTEAYYPGECFWPDKLCSDGIGCCRYFEEQDSNLIK